MTSAIDNFRGSPSEYILYLEKTIISLRQRQAQCHCHAASPHTQANDHDHVERSGHEELEIVQFCPTASSPTTNVTKKRRLERHMPRWQEKVLTLVEETPKASKWILRLQEKGIFDAMCNGKAVSNLLLLDAERETRTTSREDFSMTRVFRSSPLARIEHYARVSVQKEMTAAVATSLANYQKLLVLSACVVLAGTGTASEDVYGIVRICMGNDVTDVHCRRILRGCRFVHELMDTLYMGGWGLRAFELLLLWNKTPAFYCTVAYAYGPSLELLKDRLCNKELTGDVEMSPATWTSIFAPKIIKDILGECIEVAKVAELLGYKYTSLFNTRVNAWDYRESPDQSQVMRVE
ncbi:hypothetical protein M409DRAFT_61210 [Zasmidium cellare ATCC 36951]|uniref:Uncharacterized protein n=1 Tax=Zasmidium cellare ATCC 36951 TaxID=1080233 RepID=A0A6A6BY00_ZASCE|nr:uncharacterized protein M409DRAFT_61210 [Zasmidium cellare ATCC 36951]KAF2158938.1 hypothetical protein M409DRAFT_61210 [Zasmidium cellare ATCC 36951]